MIAVKDVAFYRLFLSAWSPENKANPPLAYHLPLLHTIGISHRLKHSTGLRPALYHELRSRTEMTAPIETAPAESNAENKMDRRDLIKTSVAVGIGACAIGAPVCAAVQLITAPIFAESAVGKFYPLPVPLDSLTETPQRFAITDDKQDAWTTLINQTIGTLYVSKINGEIYALHSLCPHAGCMVQVIGEHPVTGDKENIFSCPCHTAYFTMEGTRIGSNASPRDLDRLETKIEDGRVYVKFENFTFGIADKRAN